jgi:phosphoribosylanthranilate isomerase
VVAGGPRRIFWSVRVKFCGITRLEDAEEAARLGAWAIGLNHWEGGPREIDPGAAAEIGAALRRRLEVVGVFVNAPLARIVSAAENESLTMIQLHGDEGLEFCREVRRRTGAPIIKVIRVRSGADVQAARAFRVDYHLLDAHRPLAPGGTGESFDWELLSRRGTGSRKILAGGLRPDNVAEGIRVVRPYAVDVATGVESSPGIKDHDLMSEFFENANAAHPEPQEAAR